MFALHHNVFDEVLFAGQYYTLADFLTHVLLAPTKQRVVVYDPSNGVRIAWCRTTDGQGSDRSTDTAAAGVGGRDPARALPFLEDLLSESTSTAVIIPYAGMLAPAAEPYLLSEQDRINLISLHRWSLSSEIAARDNVVFLLTEMLSELSPKLLANPKVAAVEVALPSLTMREEIIRKADPAIDADSVSRLAEHSCGLKAMHLAGLLTPRSGGLGDGERLALVRSLLGSSKDAELRAQKLAAITRGMERRDIQHLIAPNAQSTREDPDLYAEVITVLQQRKRELIEKECVGLLEFVIADYDLSAVGGNEAITAELRQIAKNLRSGETARVPMGLLFVGPMGSGKTFVANAFANESGMSAVRLKNFRSKWVGSTEANLEKVLKVVCSLGPIVVIIDEGDRAFGGAAEQDGGTSSRVIARLKEFMSDTENRGRVLFVLMTNRPDKLDIDIKRAGRLDRKIPFFYASSAQAIEAIVDSVISRHGIASELDWARRRGDTSAQMLGYSHADIEAVVLLAWDMAREEGCSVDGVMLRRAIADYMPPRDTTMLEYMELLAAFESSRRSLLPPQYARLSASELSQRLTETRQELARRAV